MKEWISEVADLSGPLIAGAAIWLAWRTHEATRRQGQVNNIPRLLLDGYVDVPMYTPIDVASQPVLITTRDARNWARGQSSTPAGYRDFLESTVQPPDDQGRRTPQNRAAWELSSRLQVLGVSVFVGALPLDAVLADCAHPIVDDWCFCHRQVELHRSEARHPDTAAPAGVDFNRRHAEWLAGVAAEWLAKKDQYSGLDRVHEAITGIPGLNRDEASRRVRDRVRKIERFDSEILSDLTRRQLKRLRARRGWWTRS